MQNALPTICILLFAATTCFGQHSDRLEWPDEVISAWPNIVRFSMVLSDKSELEKLALDDEQKELADELVSVIKELSLQRFKLFSNELSAAGQKSFFDETIKLRKKIERFIEENLDDRQRNTTVQFFNRNRFAAYSLSCGLLIEGLHKELSLTNQQREELLAKRSQTQERLKSLEDSGNLRIAKLNLKSLEKIIDLLDEDQKKKLGDKIDQVIEEYKDRIQKLEQRKADKF